MSTRAGPLQGRFKTVSWEPFVGGLFPVCPGFVRLFVCRLSLRLLSTTTLNKPSKPAQKHIILPNFTQLSLKYADLVV